MKNSLVLDGSLEIICLNEYEMYFRQSIFLFFLIHRRIKEDSDDAIDYSMAYDSSIDYCLEYEVASFYRNLISMK